MSTSTIFDFVADQLEKRCDFNITQARGTLRIAIKEAGLDPKLITSKQMKIVLNKVLCMHLKRRKIDQKVAEQICSVITKLVDNENFSAPEGIDKLPESLFDRLNKS